MPPPSAVPIYPDDVAGAVAILTTSLGTRYYDNLASAYPSSITNTAIDEAPNCATIKGVQKLALHLRRSYQVHREITNGEGSVGVSAPGETLTGPATLETPISPDPDRLGVAGDMDSDKAPMAFVPNAPASRCGIWDSLGPSHAWRPGSIPLSTTTAEVKNDLSNLFVISTAWERLTVSPDSTGALAAPLPKSVACSLEDSVVFQGTSITLSCAKSGGDFSLISTIEGAQLTDTFKLPPYPEPGCPDMATKLFDLALGLDARSAFAILLSSDFVTITAALFHGRSSFYAGAHVGECIPGIPDTLFSFCRPSLFRPAQSMALPPKLSGVARDDSLTFAKAVEHVGARGLISLPTPFSFTIGYDIGMYGPVMGSVWANFDSSFLYDYSVGSQNAALRAILRQRYPMVCSTFNGGTYLERCIKTIAPIVWANYEAVIYKTRLEDSFENASQPCAVIWKDLSVLAAYRLVDGGFVHIWFDSDMSAEATAIAGLGIAMHDLFDLAADLSCGEVSNVVPSLTGGDLSLPSLAALYTRVGAVLRWYGSNMPHDPAALSLLLTFWWQLGNMRHRIVQAIRVPVESERIRIPRTEAIDHRPRYEDFVVSDLHNAENVWQDPKHCVPAPDFAKDSLTTEMRALAREFVVPYSSAAMSAVPDPPADHVCASRIMGVMSRGLDATNRPVMWEWSSYLWDSGTLWGSLLGTLCYRHDGSLNDDRARETHTSDVWIG